MATVRLRGLNRKTVRTSDGRTVVYWYAWKGGPRLPGQPGEPEFLEAFAKLHAERRAARLQGPAQSLAGLVSRYRAAPEFLGLADATRREWTRWLDRISFDRGPDDGPHDIGGLPLAALDDRRVRLEILAWRDQWADRPRAADYAMQVLSRVLAFGMNRGELALNAAAGIGQLYDADGRGDQVWTEGEIVAFRRAAPSFEVAAIVPLATLTGLRRADLVRLAWAHVGELAIILPTAKSRGKRSTVVPLLTETKALLAEIRRQQLARHAELTDQAKRKGRDPPPVALTVLSNTRGQPWTANGLEAQVVKVKAKAKVEKHLHDARGTFVTRLRHAGLTGAEIADVVGWSEARVERLLKTYVDRDAIVRSIADRLNKRKEE